MPVMTIVPDDKDWTWVLERACPECGFDPASVEAATVGQRFRATAEVYAAALAKSEARLRPSPTTWSPLEYSCHVRDVHRVFAGRLAQMLDEDDPQFENWDQDRAALDGRYEVQEPSEVADELVEAAAAVADRYDGVPPDAWHRPGRRSNGSRFTIETLAKYHLHDVVHHLWDIGHA
jgi:hypothetical protein